MSFELPQYTAEASGVVSFLQAAPVPTCLCWQPYTNLPNPLFYIMAARQEMDCVANFMGVVPALAKE